MKSKVKKHKYKDGFYYHYTSRTNRRRFIGNRMANIMMGYSITGIAFQNFNKNGRKHGIEIDVNFYDYELKTFKGEKW